MAKSVTIGQNLIHQIKTNYPWRTMENSNILILMVDQLSGTLFNDGPAEFLHAPHLKSLAKESARFRNTYTASPLCGPGRVSFMSSQLPSRTGVYDNAAEFSSSIPTFAHHLRRKGYLTCLSGKMHFVGPDQLHGYEERLTTDIYPVDFAWTPDYGRPGERVDWWYHNLSSVKGSGVGEITNQLEYDDEVAYHAINRIYDLSRRKEDRPWCLTVSFTHPHDPYVARRKYWDLYENCESLGPAVAAIPFDRQDPHSKRLLEASDYMSYDITEDDIRRSRRAYFANISYLDEKIGEILDVLSRCDFMENTTIVFLSDHGDMLGERGLWFKMSFFEGSSRVPLMIRSSGIESGLCETPVSTLDLLPTLADLVGMDLDGIKPWTDGISLLDTLANGSRGEPVPMEYAAEGSVSPMVALRDGQFKIVMCMEDPPQLFDLENDPNELENLADNVEFSEVFGELRKKVESKWDLQAFDAGVRESQARRHITYEALRNGSYFPWDYQPLQRASERYMRNHMDLNVVEKNQRYPKPNQGD